MRFPREVIDPEHGDRFRVGDEVLHDGEAPGSAPPGIIRRLYAADGEWWAVVAWPHWRRAFGRLWLMPTRHHHPLRELRPG